MWRNTLGQTGTGLAADGNGNHQIDAGDYEVWKKHFGESAGSGSLTNGPVPEPETLILLFTGMLVQSSRQGAAFSKHRQSSVFPSRDSERTTGL